MVEMQAEAVLAQDNARRQGDRQERREQGRGGTGNRAPYKSDNVGGGYGSDY